MAYNGKAKGSEFEREISKDLSWWFSAGQRSDLYWRSAMSGGRATMAAKKKNLLKNSSGDISAISGEGDLLVKVFMIECKFYRSLDIDQMLFTDSGTLRTVWQVVNQEALKYSKLPMLVAKQNRRPIIVCFGREGVAAIDSDRKLKIRAWFPKDDFQVFLWKDFLLLDIDLVKASLASYLERNKNENHSYG